MTMSNDRVQKAQSNLDRALDPDCDQPWQLIDEANDLLEKEIANR